MLLRDRADMPLVSVVTVTLDCEDVLEETLRATLAQDYPNIEVLVVDGGSTDATLDVIKTHESEIDLWLSAHDGGPYHAMNTAANSQGAATACS